jgi:hypothetical protein
MKKVIHFISCIIIVFILIFVSTTSSKQFINKENKQIQLIDYDPLIDINITVDIQAIRALDKIDPFSKADFFVKMFINDVEFTSPVWNNTDYLYNCYTVTTDVPDDKKTVDVTIQLWDADGDDNKQCDISKDPNINGLGLDIQLTYDVSIGRWSGDNNNADVTGYGRVSGSADGSIYKDENDCELITMDSPIG